MPPTTHPHRGEVADPSADIHHCYKIDLTEQAEPAAAARTWARQILAGRVTGAQLDDILLVQTELITNAEAHGAGVTVLRIDDFPHLITLWVFDRDDHCDKVQARPAMPTGEAMGGRGLPLVEELTTCWFTWPNDSGKAVAAVIHLGMSGETR